MDNCYNKGFYEIKRETSKYNKYMKWHLIFYREDKSMLASEYFRTEKEARASVEHSIWRGAQGFPIGNRMSYTSYQAI